MKIKTIIVGGLIACAGLYLYTSGDPAAEKIKTGANEVGKATVSAVRYVWNELKPLLKKAGKAVKESIDEAEIEETNGGENQTNTGAILIFEGKRI